MMYWHIINLSPAELLPCIYLSLGQLGPSYESSFTTGIGPAMLQTAVREVTGASAAALRAAFRVNGDLGDAVQGMKRTQTLNHYFGSKQSKPAALTAVQVFQTLRGFVSLQLNTQAKLQALRGLLSSAGDGLEAKYVVRICERNMRIHCNEKTILTAVSRAALLYSFMTNALEKKEEEIEMTDPEKLMLALQDKQLKGSLAAFAEVWTQATKEALHCYHQCPNPGLFVKMMLHLPQDSTRIMEYLSQRAATMVQAGTPIKPMLGKVASSVRFLTKNFAGATVSCEIKYDGMRAQIHLLPDGTLKAFSRNLEDNTHMWPELASAFSVAFAPTLTTATNNSPRLASLSPADQTQVDEWLAWLHSSSSEPKSFILDAELVAVQRGEEEEGGYKVLPFQQLSTRPRAKGESAVAVPKEAVQVMVFAFDMMAINGRSLLRAPFSVRRQLLRSTFSPNPGYFDFVGGIDCEIPSEIPEEEEGAGEGNVVLSPVEESIMEFMKASLKFGEGLMVKSLGEGSIYEPDRRSDLWLKAKKDYLGGLALHDTLDLVPLGGWHGLGRKAQWYSPILLGVYDPETETYQAICKCMSGFTDEFYKAMTARFSEKQLEAPPSDYSVDPDMQPAVWFPLGEVWEVRGADLTISPVHRAAIGLVHPSKGLSLRFPRFMRVRPDKEPSQATTAQQLAHMYQQQGGAAKMGGQSDDED